LRTLQPTKSNLPAETASARLCAVVTRWSLALAILFIGLAGSPARADVGVVLNESLDTSVARITGSGHSAVYFSRICPETPVKLRLCGPGEQGSVMSNYTTLGEDQPFEWNVVPLNIYLYGVEDPQNRPLLGSHNIKYALEERYREKYLSGYCEGKFCRTSNSAEWREMVGASLSRSMYAFIVQTTVEQDRALIEEFNSAPNVNHFNGMTRNCADFTRRVINYYFPHAAKPDYLNDFGMTSPKAIARSFSHYAAKHPEAHFRVLHFAQIPGTLKRSSECRGGTEQLVRSKKLLVPMLVFADHELPFVAASYVLTGRFNPEHELENHPSVEASDLSHEIQEAKSAKNEALAAALETEEIQERVQAVGSSEEWKEYRKALKTLAGEAVNREIVPDRDYLNHLFKYLDRVGTLRFGSDGELWMDISENGATTEIGLSPGNFLASGSGSQLSYALALARASYFVRAPKHSRETMLEFKADWALLQSARVTNSAITTSVAAALPLANGRGASSIPRIQ
jgi:hypothetical protein